LAGAIVHHLLLAALLAGEQQRRETADSYRALRYRERLLRHAMRVETVGDLAGLVSHQLRNAFQIMLGHVALGDVSDEAERARRLHLVGETLEGSRPLLDELMGLAHPEEGQAEPTDLGRAVARFVDRARLVVPTTIVLLHERDFGEALPVNLDVRGLEHALWNLVINAKQAMPDGGRITVRTGSGSDSAWVAIVDTGPGIPEQIRDRIFDPYFTTKPPGEGTGLGLAAVARFARSSGGSVDVDSEIDRGTTFLLSFPLATDAGISAVG
jgi:signal transduction histidine kinase